MDSPGPSSPNWVTSCESSARAYSEGEGELAFEAIRSLEDEARLLARGDHSSDAVGRGVRDSQVQKSAPQKDEVRRVRGCRLRKEVVAECGMLGGGRRKKTGAIARSSEPDKRWAQMKSGFERTIQREVCPV